MAPKKSLSAAGGGEFPSLRLVFTEGPNSGQTNGYKPGSKIRVGRVVRGNTLSIKDAGVSSKHLLIQVENSSDLVAKGWAVTDLGSSNGTILNRQMLEPSQPVLLSEGDVIKIGEVTSITVEFEVNNVETDTNATTQRRIPKRKAARNQVSRLGAIEEEPLGSMSGIVNKEEEEEEERIRVPELGNTAGVKNQKLSVRKTGRRSTKQEQSKSSSIKEKAAVETENVAEELDAGRTTEEIGACSRASELVNTIAEAEIPGQMDTRRRTRRSTKQQNFKSSSLKMEAQDAVVVLEEATRMPTVKEDEEEEEEGTDTNATTLRRNPKRRAARNQVSRLGVIEEERLGSISGIVNKEEELIRAPHTAGVKKQKFSVRKTGRRSTKQEPSKPPSSIIEKAAVETENVAEESDAQETQNVVVGLEEGTRMMPTVEEDEEETGGCSCASELENGVAGIDLGNEIMGKTSFKRSIKQETLKSSIIKEEEVVEETAEFHTEMPSNVSCPKRTRSSNAVVDSEKVSDVVEEEEEEEVPPLDLSKIALGEWLGFLEEYLPKQIMQKTDAMIFDMRQKAGRLQEFLAQQKNNNMDV